jgi:hypothetical protein
MPACCESAAFGGLAGAGDCCSGAHAIAVVAIKAMTNFI